MNPLEALNAAIIEADAVGDADTVNRLYAMRTDSAAIGRLLLALDSYPDDATQKFADAAGAYSCVMLPLVGDEADAVLALGQRVAMRDLHEKGLEYDPHITALHGLHEGTLPAVETVAKEFGAIPVWLGRVSVFPANPQKPYDVLKIGVHSPDLMRLNSKLRQLPNSNEYPSFAPHVTIGYLKPGRGEAYARRFGNVGKTFTVPCLLYSDELKRQSTIPLGATLSFAEWTQGKSPVTGEQGWLSSGGQFRKEKPEGGAADEAGGDEHRLRVSKLVGAVTKSLANEPELKDNPGLLQKATDLAATGAAKVLFAVQAIQDHWTGKALGGIVDAYFDNPTDMGKLGYNPGNSAQTASPKVMDPVSGTLQDVVGFGLSGHLVAKIAAEVLSRGFLFLRNKVRAAQMADGQETPRELAEVLAKLFNEVNAALGLDGKNDPEEIAKKIAPLMQGQAEGFGDWKPGQSPKTGEHGWLSAGGAFRKNRPEGVKTDEERGQGSLFDNSPDNKEGEESAVHVNATEPFAAVNELAAKTADPVAKDFLESAVYNANEGDVKDLAAQLSASWRVAKEMKNEKAAELVASVLPLTGAKFDGPERGKPVTYSGKLYESQAGMFPGDAATVVRQPIVHEDGHVLLKGQVAPAGTKMADDEPTNQDLKPVTGAGGKPASGEVALAGKDGAALAHVIREAKAFGVSRVNAIMQQAADRYPGKGPFLSDEETRHVGDALAAVNASAELLGRARVRDLQERAGATQAGDDQPFKKFADSPLSAIATPKAALDYFTSLYPSIGVDPERFPGEQRRRAFTLAADLNENVTAAIQKRLAESLATHEGTADASDAIRRALELAGVTGANPQYSEMVFRTNAMDAYQTGAYEEGTHPDVADIFPCWQYLGISDGRAGEDHKPHFGKYYPRAAKFADVRGNRPFNCRCSLRWVDQFEWDELQGKGVKTEDV